MVKIQLYFYIVLLFLFLFPTPFQLFIPLIFIPFLLFSSFFSFLLIVFIFFPDSFFLIPSLLKKTSLLYYEAKPESYKTIHHFYSDFPKFWKILLPLSSITFPKSYGVWFFFFCVINLTKRTQYKLALIWATFIFSQD